MQPPAVGVHQRGGRCQAQQERVAPRAAPPLPNGAETKNGQIGEDNEKAAVQVGPERHQWRNRPDARRRLPAVLLDDPGHQRQQQQAKQMRPRQEVNVEHIDPQ